MGIHFTFITKIPGGTLLTKMPTELPSTEQIFVETNHLVPLSKIKTKQSENGSREFLKGIRHGDLADSWLKTILEIRDCAIIIWRGGGWETRGVGIGESQN